MHPLNTFAQNPTLNVGYWRAFETNIKTRLRYNYPKAIANYKLQYDNPDHG
jgi:hypothetical protein